MILQCIAVKQRDSLRISTSRGGSWRDKVPGNLSGDGAMSPKINVPRPSEKARQKISHDLVKRRRQSDMIEVRPSKK